MIGALQVRARGDMHWRMWSCASPKAELSTARLERDAAVMAARGGAAAARACVDVAVQTLPASGGGAAPPPIPSSRRGTAPRGRGGAGAGDGGGGGGARAHSAFVARLLATAAGEATTGEGVAAWSRGLRAGGPPDAESGAGPGRGAGNGAWAGAVRAYEVAREVEDAAARE